MSASWKKLWHGRKIEGCEPRDLRLAQRERVQSDLGQFAAEFGELVDRLTGGGRVVSDTRLLLRAEHVGHFLQRERRRFIFSRDKNERTTRRHTPREVMPFRVYGQPTRIRIHWHVPNKSSLPEENKGDTSETRTRDHKVTSRASCLFPARNFPCSLATRIRVCKLLHWKF